MVASFLPGTGTHSSEPRPSEPICRCRCNDHHDAFASTIKRREIWNLQLDGRTENMEIRINRWQTVPNYSSTSFRRGVWA